MMGTSSDWGGGVHFVLKWVFSMCMTTQTTVHIIYCIVQKELPQCDDTMAWKQLSSGCQLRDNSLWEWGAVLEHVICAFN